MSWIKNLQRTVTVMRVASEARARSFVVPALLSAISFVAPGEASAQETFRDAIRIADSAWTGKSFAAAKLTYQRALDFDSLASSRAVYRLAILRSWDGELTGAIALLTRYVRLEPHDDEGRIALARVYSWHGETRSAVAVYDSVLARDATYRDAALGAAQALAWGGKYDDALARYDAWLLRMPHDHEAALARARTLAWGGHLGGAERAYRQIAADGEPLEGRKGEATIAAWKGDLFSSETKWTRLTRDFPGDARVWLGLAQTLRWSGRMLDSRDALKRALAIAPNDADARAEHRQVEGVLAPAIAPAMSWSWDSDGNRALLSELRASLPSLRLVNASLSVSQRQADLGALTAKSTASHLTMRWLAERHLALSGSIGVVQAATAGAAMVMDRTRVVGNGQATVKLTSRVTLGGYFGHDVFDETASGVASSLAVTTTNVEGAIDLGARMSFGASTERAHFSGGSGPNERSGIAGSLRWRAKRSLRFTMSARAMGYDRQTHDGYFAPARYRLGELSGRYESQRERGWLGFVELGGGLQSVRSTIDDRTQATQRGGIGLTHRWLNGNDIGVEYVGGNVAGSAAIVGARGVYRYQSITARARVRLR